MLKQKRLISILDVVNLHNFVKNKDLIELLNVSDMTIRRDINELEKAGKLIRIHGGVQKISSNHSNIELAHDEKQYINQKEKLEIAEKAVSQIENGETIFLGTGTTIEMFSKFFTNDYLKIITNSLPVFNSLQDKLGQYEIILLGGLYRIKTGAFIGTITIESMKNIRFSKSFIGVNGIFNDGLYNHNSDEGKIQSIALDLADSKYILADEHKLNKTDFYKFYDLTKIDYLILNNNIDDKYKKDYKKFVKLL